MCQVGISHVSDNYPIGAKQNVNKHDSALLVETLDEDGQTFFMDSAETPNKPVKKRVNQSKDYERNVISFEIEGLLPECANVPSKLSMEQANLVVFPHKICT